MIWKTREMSRAVRWILVGTAALLWTAVATADPADGESIEFSEEQRQALHDARADQIRDARDQVEGINQATEPIL